MSDRIAPLDVDGVRRRASASGDGRRATAVPKLDRYHEARDLLALAALSVFAAARSATTQSSINVSASVSGTCAISSTALSFGLYSPGATLSDAGVLTVRCTNGIPFSIALGDGQGVGGGRRMTGLGGATLPYEVYLDSGQSRRWDAESNTRAGVGTGGDQPFSLFGHIPPSPAAAGEYEDTVTVSLTY